MFLFNRSLFCRVAKLLAILPLCLSAVSATAQPAAPNLVQNGGFEDVGAGWAGCGTVEVVAPSDLPVPMRGIREGQHAVRLRYNSQNACPGFLSPNFQLVQDVSIPASATALTISFWFARVGDPGVNIELALQGASSINLGRLSRNTPLGWNVFHRVLSAAEVASVRGRTARLSFTAASLFTSSTIPAEAPGDLAATEPGFYLDNIRIAAAEEPELVVPEDPPASAENLLADGDFEGGYGLWELCGGDTGLIDASQVTTPARRIRNGTKAMKFAYDLNLHCHREFLRPNFQFGHRLAIPADAMDLTITFWSSRVGDPRVNLDLGLEAPDDFGPVVSLPSVLRSGPTGWTAYHYALTAEQLARVRGRVLRLKFFGGLFGSLSQGVGVLPDDPPTDNPGFFVDDVRVVARRVPKPIAAEDPTSAADTLIVNGGFEQRFRGWELCGDLLLADATAAAATPLTVHQGRHALRLLYSTNRNCNLDLSGPQMICGQGFTVPPDAPDLTLAFWYSRVGDPGANLWIKFSTTYGSVAGEVNVSNLRAENLGGWSLYRYALNTNQVAALRGKRLYLAFYFAIDFSRTLSAAAIAATPGPPGFYIDDVRVVPRLERTTASPLPADLRGDGSRPLALINSAVGGLARMNTDGSGLQRVTGGAHLTGVLSPTWSGDGERLLFHEPWLFPENPILPPEEFRARTTIVSDVPAAGGDPRELTRTTGLTGQRAQPLNCELTTPSFCTRAEQGALDFEVVTTEAEPGGQRVAYSVCVRNRYFSGARDDPTCFVQIQRPNDDILVNPNAIKIQPAFLPSWSRTGRMLFQNHDAVATNDQGIIEADLTQNPPVLRQLVPDTGFQFHPSFQHDSNPVWAPDGRHFVTYRDVNGAHWVGGGADTFQHFRGHRSIVWHDREQPQFPRQLLLADHGDSVSWLEVSPDGKYVLYSLIQGNQSDIWWLDVNTGATGPITTGGQSIAAKWRPSGGTTPDPIRLGATWVNGNTLRMTLTAPAGNYVVSGSPDFRQWTDLFPVAVGASGRASFDDSGNPASQRRYFYRARVETPAAPAANR